MRRATARTRRGRTAANSRETRKAPTLTTKQRLEGTQLELPNPRAPPPPPSSSVQPPTSQLHADAGGQNALALDRTIDQSVPSAQHGGVNAASNTMDNSKNAALQKFVSETLSSGVISLTKEFDVLQAERPPITAVAWSRNMDKNRYKGWQTKREKLFAMHICVAKSGREKVFVGVVCRHSMCG